MLAAAAAYLRHHLLGFFVPAASTRCQQDLQVLQPHCVHAQLLGAMNTATAGASTK